MTQYLFNIMDEKMAAKLLEFLKTLDYLRVHKLTEKNVLIPETMKELMLDRF